MARGATGPSPLKADSDSPRKSPRVLSRSHPRSSTRLACRHNHRLHARSKLVCGKMAPRSGGIAQLGERLHGMQEVRGSSPLASTRFQYFRVRGLPVRALQGGGAAPRRGKARTASAHSQTGRKRSTRFQYFRVRGLPVRAFPGGGAAPRGVKARTASAHSKTGRGPFEPPCLHQVPVF